MRIKRFNNPIQTQIQIKDYINLVDAILREIKEFDEDNKNNEYYDGILSERTGNKIKSILPELAKKYSIL